jgi:hypothetical protein
MKPINNSNALKTKCFECYDKTFSESTPRGLLFIEECLTCRGVGEIEKGVYIHQDIKNTILIGYFNTLTYRSVVGVVVLSPKFTSMSMGYRYNQWSLASEIDFVAPIDAFLNHFGYMKFIEHASYEQISNFFKVKDAVSKAVAVDSRLLVANNFYDLVANKKGDDSIFSYFFS